MVVAMARELTKDDFPIDEPVVIWRTVRGAWWCANSSGYTTTILDAGLYERDEAFSICFADEKNGYSDNYGVPIRRALAGGRWTREELRKMREKLMMLEPYAQTDAEQEKANQEHSAKLKAELEEGEKRRLRNKRRRERRAEKKRLSLEPCCPNESRNMNGGCDNCGDPSL